MKNKIILVLLGLFIGLAAATFAQPVYAQETDFSEELALLNEALNTLSITLDQLSLTVSASNAYQLAEIQMSAEEINVALGRISESLSALTITLAQVESLSGNQQIAGPEASPAIAAEGSVNRSFLTASVFQSIPVQIATIATLTILALLVVFRKKIATAEVKSQAN